jgi:hypothetical protein
LMSALKEVEYIAKWQEQTPSKTRAELRGLEDDGRVSRTRAAPRRALEENISGDQKKTAQRRITRREEGDGAQKNRSETAGERKLETGDWQKVEGV